MGEAFSSHGEADAVGLMTGDVTINPNANCIVMTTEILRSMLYRGSLLLREVAWVVFDEVHYMQDKERGVVWEETIIVLPKEVKMVFLSATLSNAGEFAGWVAHLHKQPCHVVNTDFRPTPLRHYGFPLGGTGLYNLKGEDGIFRGTNFRNLRDSFENIGKKIGGDGQRSGDGRCGRDRGSRRISKQELMDTKMKNVQEITRIMKLLKDKDFIPAIVFSFSKRETELNAMEIANTNFNTEEESAKIREVCTNALSCLSENDRDLPAVQHLLPILEKGVGVHHAGLLPILKEITEILFQEHLVKVLCATETFAMGVNMPARAVIFSSLRKFDGKEERYIKSGEYIQMSGRAGRRGIDDRGYVILMIDEQLDEETCRSMLLGEPAPLKSSFRLSYYTLLNLMRRVEGTQQSMDDVIKLSFQQYQHDRNVPKMEQELKQLEQQAKDALGSMSTDSVLEYNRVSKAIRKLQKLVRKRTVLVPIRILHVLQPGRLVNVAKWGWGMCVSVVREEGKGFKKDSYMLDTLLCCKKDENRGTAQAESVGHDSPNCELNVVPVPLEAVEAISSLVLPLPEDLCPVDARLGVLQSLRSIHARFQDGLPLLDPITDMGITDPEMLAAVKEIQELETKLLKNPVRQEMQSKDSEKHLRTKAKLEAQADQLRADMHKSLLSSFREEAKHRVSILEKLGHLNAEGVVQLKGKAACEIDTADELLCTELMFNGGLSDLDKHQLAALLSCLIPTEKSEEEIKLKTELSGPLHKLQETARMIAEVSTECKLKVEAEEYISSFKPFLMDVVYAWSKGASFAEICDMTDIFEGSIIRATRRLDELMMQLAEAARVVGDEDLAKKFQESDATLKRDIIFAASLYV
ncbi:unnamed protein product [Ostreobium quekettii]|uniref:Uncharacterized protein n=1 Tax=Ostreobium quekettii TaxID=121088 RepID=A0A8S1J197_9CHLO|nr:unnamed protein product [Ostreobium quekettii]